MKFIKKILIIFFLNIFINNYVHANEKIVFFDVNVLLNETNIGIKTLKIINDLNDKNIQKLKNNEEKLKKQENEIKKKQNIISSEELKKEIELLNENFKIFKTEKNNMVDNYKKIKEKEFSNFFDKINPIIQTYMNENSIDILIERKNVFLGKISSDITKNLVLVINNKIE
tara:strand:- start:406 stop:918 length:513 start_codon:yes stop_codon:yes gene_type:complete